MPYRVPPILLDRLETVRSDVLRYSRDLAANGSDKTSWITHGSDGEVHRPPGLLLKGYVHMRFRLVSDRPSNVAYDSHNLVEFRIVVIVLRKLQTETGRIHAWPQAMERVGHGLVNQHDTLPLAPVVFCERSSAEQGDAHRLEIVGAD